jgi:hypothetical protein
VIRLIVQTNATERCFQSNGHIDTSYRVFEVENEAFEELIKVGGSLTLIGLEVSEECLSAPLPAAASQLPAVGAPTPALAEPGKVASDGAPASGLPLALVSQPSPRDTKPTFRRYGRLNWRKWFRLPPYQSPTVASLPKVIKLPG